MAWQDAIIGGAGGKSRARPDRGQALTRPDGDRIQTTARAGDQAGNCRNTGSILAFPIYRPLLERGGPSFIAGEPKGNTRKPRKGMDFGERYGVDGRR